MNKEDWQTFYEIRYHIIEVSKNIDDNLKNNIITILETGNLDDLNAILKMRWLEYFKPKDLVDILINSKPGILETLYKSDYWLSKQKRSIFYVYETNRGDVMVELHSNLAFPLFEKLMITGYIWAKNIMLKYIKEMFSKDDIPTMLYLIDSFTKYFDREITHLVKKISFNSCKRLIKELFESHLSYDSLHFILQKLFSVRVFKKNIMDLYIQDKDYFSNYIWDIIKKDLS